mmetsp:Transcript_51702/g.134227  ORF Transcript_51702/g.134227 Transcript_51702/m.134227 type:complete len:200 (-) Transcript_51702:342-941(-)
MPRSIRTSLPTRGLPTSSTSRGFSAWRRVASSADCSRQSQRTGLMRRQHSAMLFSSPSTAWRSKSVGCRRRTCQSSPTTVILPTLRVLRTSSTSPRRRPREVRQSTGLGSPASREARVSRDYLPRALSRCGTTHPASFAARLRHSGWATRTVSWLHDAHPERGNTIVIRTHSHAHNRTTRQSYWSTRLAPMPTRVLCAA